MATCAQTRRAFPGFRNYIYLLWWGLVYKIDMFGFWTER